MAAIGLTADRRRLLRWSCAESEGQNCGKYAWTAPRRTQCPEGEAFGYELLRTVEAADSRAAPRAKELPGMHSAKRSHTNSEPTSLGTQVVVH